MPRPRIFVGLLTLLLLLMATSCLGTTTPADGSILVRNVWLVRPEDASQVQVSILIKAWKLDLVTEEPIPADQATLALDGEGGFLLGKLNVGGPAGFLILDTDPREEVTVLLDTAAHVRFAIHAGEILKNELPPVDPSQDSSSARKRSGWLAYTPPPLALPMSYKDETKWNRWERKYFSGIFLAAVILDRQHWLAQDGASEEQVGDLQEFDGGEIRGFRVGSVGTFNFRRPWVYTFFVATNAFEKGFNTRRDDGLTLFDYRLDIPLPLETTLSLGKQKEPISMERLMSLVFLPMQERSSASDALLPARNVGLVWSGGGFQKRMTWAGGVFNDWFDAGQSFESSSTQFTGRLTSLALVSEDESNLLHLGLGVRFSDAKESIRIRTEPEFDQAPLFVDTGAFEADRGTGLNGEITWRRGPLWLAGEYLYSSIDSPSVENPRFHGYHLTGSWAFSGEMRAYNRQAGILNPLPVSRSVHQGGWGAWEASVRWSDLDLNDGSIAGGRMQIASVGLNWWLTPVFHVSVDYRHIRLDRDGVVGHSDGLNVRVLLMLE
jgi:phosphate-selective porin OprO/OprP